MDTRKWQNQFCMVVSCYLQTWRQIFSFTERGPTKPPYVDASRSVSDQRQVLAWPNGAHCHILRGGPLQPKRAAPRCPSTHATCTSCVFHQRALSRANTSEPLGAGNTARGGRRGQLSTHTGFTPHGSQAEPSSADCPPLCQCCPIYAADGPARFELKKRFLCN